MNKSNVERRFAVVTGASSGIGRELARVFQENEFDLLIAAGSEQIEETKAELNAGGKVETVQADLATREGVEKLWAAVQATGRPVDAIAINAGVGVGGDFVSETSLDDELNMLQVNVVGTTHLAKLAAQQMAARGEGRILITASIAAVMPTPLEAVYGATKAYDLALAQNLRHELKDKGVVVTALQPGATDTNFFHRAGLDDSDVGRKGKEENNPYEVARQGFKALMNGDDHVYASSFMTKVQGAVSSVVPDAVLAKMHKNIAEKKAS